jgi:glycosyltransferase involved in cell wall biosynthesis
MRICIDATSLLLRSAGVKNYVYHWMRSLRAEAPQFEISAFPLLGDVGSLHHERSVLNIWQTLPRIALLHASNLFGVGLIDAAVGRADVFHASNQVHTLPDRPKLTATIYDLTVKRMPELHTPGNIKAENGFYDRVLKRADGLIAISESAKSDAVQLLGLRDDHIAVIYPGIDERFFAAAPLKRPKPYVLFVGTIEPRKNLDILLDAWLELPLDTRQTHDLVISGPVGWAAQRTVDRLGSGILGVEYVGYSPEADLPSLVSGASVFVYPSLYEGFGFPPAQAMAAGVPVITSNLSSLPEVVGDAGILVDPKDSFALRDEMQHLLTSPSTRETLGKKGKERAGKFAWKNSAKASVEFFQRL